MLSFFKEQVTRILRYQLFKKKINRPTRYLRKKRGGAAHKLFSATLGEYSLDWIPYLVYK